MINNTNENDIIDKHKSILNRYRLCAKEQNKFLPHIYWLLNDKCPQGNDIIDNYAVIKQINDKIFKLKNKSACTNSLRNY